MATIRAQSAVSAEQKMNVEDLARQKERKEALRANAENDIAEWVEDQEDEESKRMAMLGNQRAHMERIKNRASQARNQAKKHNKNLIDELTDVMSGKQDLEE